MGKRRKTGAADIDVYQADDSDPEEEQQAGQRFDVSSADQSGCLKLKSCEIDQCSYKEACGT